jgi:alkanesulfonate monooxygenase SsuD/methylene tetrahydromethanopterin reductase-like flavin-dependent oxidoreductase (luciferase family)
MLHSLTSAEYVRTVVQPNLTRGAQLAGRDPSQVRVSGGGFIITGPNQATLQAAAEEVRKRIAFYASTRTYFPVLECHGFQEIGQRLHQMSLRGQWAEMGSLVTDAMLDTFAVVGEYDEIAGKIMQRYSGLLDEVSFAMNTASSADEAELRRIIKQIQDMG